MTWMCLHQIKIISLVSEATSHNTSCTETLVESHEPTTDEKLGILSTLIYRGRGSEPQIAYEGDTILNFVPNLMLKRFFKSLIP